MDGGVRSGQDVLRAIALGAKVRLTLLRVLPELPVLPSASTPDPWPLTPDP